MNETTSRGGIITPQDLEMGATPTFKILGVGIGPKILGAGWSGSTPLEKEVGRENRDGNFSNILSIL